MCDSESCCYICPAKWGSIALTIFWAMMYTVNISTDVLKDNFPNAVSLLGIFGVVCSMVAFTGVIREIPALLVPYIFFQIFHMILWAISFVYLVVVKKPMIELNDQNFFIPNDPQVHTSTIIGGLVFYVVWWHFVAVVYYHYKETINTRTRARPGYTSIA